MVKRCKWAEADELMITYHDQEWGKQVLDDRALFELLTLELFQTGLSWRTILHRREGFRQAFDNFRIEKIAMYNEQKVQELVGNPGIIRHRGKIAATIHNAKSVLSLIETYGSLYQFFTSLPEEVKEQQKLMRKTFKHVGPSVLESFLIAGGFAQVQHEPDCFMAVSQKRDNMRSETNA